MKIKSKLLKESAQPMGGDGKNFYMFYLREVNSRKDVIDFAKDHGCDMIYWASDEAPYYGFKGGYNGDCLVVFNSENIDNIPDPYRQDAEEFGEPINESLTEGYEDDDYIQALQDIMEREDPKETGSKSAFNRCVRAASKELGISKQEAADLYRDIFCWFSEDLDESLLNPNRRERYTVEYENTTGVGTYGQASIREIGHFNDLEDAIKFAKNAAISRGGYTIYVADEEKENRDPVYKVVARWRGDNCKLEQSPGGTEYVDVDMSGYCWKIKESLNEATSKEILNALRTKKLSKDGFLQIGDAKTGWTAQIQDPGALELDMEHNSTKLKSGAWGRIWHHKKLVKQFHGPVNVVRDQMIKFFEGEKPLTEDGEDLRSLARPNEMRILDIYYNYELNAEDILLGLLKYLPDNDLAGYADDLEEMFEDADEEE